jgi:hypothetical protein
VDAEADVTAENAENEDWRKGEERDCVKDGAEVDVEIVLEDWSDVELLEEPRRSKTFSL